MEPTPIVERAYQLAKSGEFAGITEVKKRLKVEGYQQIEVHLSGLALSRAISELCRKARNSGGPS